MAQLLRLATFLSLAACVSPPAGHDERPPNILFVLTDDQRADSIGALGGVPALTPAIDDLVRRGFAFRRAYCMGSRQGAVCVPSRAMILSGRSLERVPNDLEGVETLPALFAAAGYRTFATGKWHNGRTSLSVGFAEARSVLLGGMSDHTRVPLHDFSRDTGWIERGVGDGYSTELFTEEALAFLDRQGGDRPFFCYVAYTAPHDPRQAVEPYASEVHDDPPSLPPNFLPHHPFDNGCLVVRDEELAAWPREEGVVREQLADYYAMVAHLDAQIGRLLDALRERDLERDTIVVFASDHGLALGSHGLLGKQSVYEHSTRTPLVFAGPGVPRGSSDALCYLFDAAPTLYGLAGLDPPTGLDGIDLEPAFAGDPGAGRDELLLRYGNGQRAIVTPRWKLVRYPRIHHTQLFDLDADPHECSSLAGAQLRELEQSLLDRLAMLQLEFGDELTLTAAERDPFVRDLSGRARRPDPHQPPELVERYFGPSGVGLER